MNEQQNSQWSGTSWTVLLFGSSMGSEVASRPETFSDSFTIVTQGLWSMKNVTVTMPNIYAFA